MNDTLNFLRDKFKLENPFYDNHTFTKNDLDRKKITRWEYPLLFFLPTFVQLADGYVWFYKIFQGRYFLMKVVLITKSD